MTTILVDADDFVKETLGFILHNDRSYYPNLKKIKSRPIAVDKQLWNSKYYKSMLPELCCQKPIYS